jgi:tungstate transport system permease protein
MLATLLEAFSLLTRLDPRVMAIVWPSVKVSVSAVVIGAFVALPFGAWVAVSEFRGRTALAPSLAGPG